MSQVWLGGIYLKDEGGYEIILRALNHYKKRLRTIGSSPEMAGAPMFGQIVQHEAAKALAFTDEVIDKIRKGLENSDLLKEIQKDIPIIEKALACYKSDIGKAKRGEDEFYSKLVSDAQIAASDFTNVENALERLRQIS